MSLQGCQREQNGGMASLTAAVDPYTWGLCCGEERGCITSTQTPRASQGSVALGAAKMLQLPHNKPRVSLGHSLQKAWLVLLFIVWPKLDLALVASKFTGFVKGDRVRTVQDVVTSLHGNKRHCGLGSHTALSVLSSLSSHNMFYRLRRSDSEKQEYVGPHCSIQAPRHPVWERNSSRISGWFLPDRADMGFPGELRSTERIGLGLPASVDSHPGHNWVSQSTPPP